MDIGALFAITTGGGFVTGAFCAWLVHQYRKETEIKDTRSVEITIEGTSDVEAAMKLFRQKQEQILSRPSLRESVNTTRKNAIRNKEITNAKRSSSSSSSTTNPSSSPASHIYDYGGGSSYSSDSSSCSDGGSSYSCSD